MLAGVDADFTRQVKEQARLQGADLVGVASMDRFEGAPKQYDPRYIFPDAKAMVVLGFRIPRGTLRGIEEGTYFIGYSSMGYSAINHVRQPMVLWGLTNFLEDRGWEAVPIHNEWRWTHGVRKDGTTTSRPVSPDKPAPDVKIQMRLAAVAAGLGEIGWNHLLLTPEFGPRQRLACLITDAPLEPDPLFEGQICDRCFMCAQDCTGKAISTTESETLILAGKKLEWGKFDVAACGEAFENPPAEYNPFNAPPMPLWDYAHAVEGARGCIRACMIHLEATGRIQNQFHHPFRRHKPWRIEE